MERAELTPPPKIGTLSGEEGRFSKEDTSKRPQHFVRRFLMRWIGALRSTKAAGFDAYPMQGRKEMYTGFA